MAFNLKKIKNLPIEADFEKNGEKLHLQIDADIVTPNFLKEIRELAKHEKETDIDSNTENALYMARVLSKIIVGWDMVDNNQPVAPTFDLFTEFPLIFLGELFNFTMQSLAPKKTTDNQSEDSISEQVN